jgi:hypothetical protein
MTRIVVDSVTKARLENITEVVELCDEAGHLIGEFIPKRLDLSEWEPVTPGISDEELHRRLNSNEKRYTTAEVIKHLETL